ncbi:MAG: AEC family transporter [Clostridia bacterium]|nr:AEC family transporter [Clostridia bacterium]
MSENLLYCVNTVVPIFILVFLGQLFLRIKLLDSAFFDNAEKFVFKLALPCSLFLSVYRADASKAFDLKLIMFCAVAILLNALIPCLTVPLLIKDNPKRGAFIQGVYRSNFAILGIPLVKRLFPETGEAVAASVVPLAIPMFNIIAVIVLTVFAPETEEKASPWQTVKRSLIGVVKNPLIIGVLLGMPFMLTSLTLPDIVYTGVEYMADLCTPLALMCLGASIRFDRLKGRIGLAALATLFKIAIVPGLALTAAALLGLRGAQLGTVLIMLGGPMAVSGYIMAKNMKSDHELAGQILLLSTLFCIATIFIAVYVMKTLALI